MNIFNRNNELKAFIALKYGNPYNPALLTIFDYRNALPNMNNTELKTYIRLKYFPISATVKYFQQLPKPVLIDYHKIFFKNNPDPIPERIVFELCLFFETIDKLSAVGTVLGTLADNDLYDLLLEFYTKNPTL